MQDAHNLYAFAKNAVQSRAAFPFGGHAAALDLLGPSTLVVKANLQTAPIAAALRGSQKSE
jgi:hypothetical protein